MTEITETKSHLKPEIFYDAQCSVCAAAFKLVGKIFVRRGFHWVPMQTSGLAERLGISEAELHREMKLLQPGGELSGGIDAWIYLFRSVWWLRLLAVFLQLPGIHWMAGAFYQWLARNRYCIGGQCKIREARHRHSAFLELP